MRTRALIVSTVIVIVIIFLTVPQLHTEIAKLLSYNPCNTPISYKLGTLDSQFGLSQKAAVADIQSATDIWSKTYGKPLFAATSTATLTVNFVYDQRSALNQHINQLNNQLGQKDTTIQQQIKSYETDVAAFEKKLADYNAQVDQLNKSGGAPPDVYNSLIAQQNELNAEGDALNVRTQQLNFATRDFNSNVKNLNQNVDQFNQALTQKPEEGLYDGNQMTITIYFANNRQELIHTLAHEFGHALGMQHTSTPQSIMYPNTTSFLLVTPQDKQQLSNACQEQQLPVYWIQTLAIRIRSTINKYTAN